MCAAVPRAYALGWRTLNHMTALEWFGIAGRKLMTPRGAVKRATSRGDTDCVPGLHGKQAGDGGGGSSRAARARVDREAARCAARETTRSHQGELRVTRVPMGLLCHTAIMEHWDGLPQLTAQ